MSSTLGLQREAIHRWIIHIDNSPDISEQMRTCQEMMSALPGWNILLLGEHDRLDRFAFTPAFHKRAYKYILKLSWSRTKTYRNEAWKHKLGL